MYLLSDCKLIQDLGILFDVQRHIFVACRFSGVVVAVAFPLRQSAAGNEDNDHCKMHAKCNVSFEVNKEMTELILYSSSFIGISIVQYVPKSAIATRRLKRLRYS